MTAIITNQMPAFNIDSVEAGIPDNDVEDEDDGTDVGYEEEECDTTIILKTTIISLLKDNKTKEEICTIMGITDEDFNTILWGE